MKAPHTRSLLNALILISAAIAIYFDCQSSSWFWAFKPLTTALVILIPVLTEGRNRKFRRWLILALCLCLLGDILLLKNNYFVFGLAAFFIAHLFFLKAFISLEGFQKNTITALVLLMIGIALYAWLYPDLGNLKFPVAAYILVILFMAWQGTAIYLKERTTAFAFIAMGVLLFMFSDSMIAVNKFKTPFELSGLVILSSYWLAIALIANATVLILNNDYR